MFLFFQTFHLCFSYSLVSICVYEIRARDLSHKLTLWKATNRASVWVCKKIFLYFFLWRIAILVIQTKNFQIIPGNPKQNLYLGNILNLKIYNFRGALCLFRYLWYLVIFLWNTWNTLKYSTFEVTLAYNETLVVRMRCFEYFENIWEICWGWKLLEYFEIFHFSRWWWL